MPATHVGTRNVLAFEALSSRCHGLLDHLVRQEEEGRWNREAEGSGDPQVSN